MELGLLGVNSSRGARGDRKVKSVELGLLGVNSSRGDRRDRKVNLAELSFVGEGRKGRSCWREDSC